MGRFYGGPRRAASHAGTGGTRKGGDGFGDVFFPGTAGILPAAVRGVSRRGSSAEQHGTCRSGRDARGPRKNASPHSPGVTPSTMTKCAVSSPVFDPFSLAKSTVIASRCFASFTLFQMLSFSLPA
jgi:hypothetical protein